MKRLLFTILAVELAFGLVAYYQVYRASATTPDGAVQQYIDCITQDAPQKIESISVVSNGAAQNSNQDRLLLFRAMEAGTGVHVAGYAILQQTIFGWHVQKLQMTGKLPLPQDILAQLDWSDGRPVFFGEVLLLGTTSVEAVFDDPNRGRVVLRVETPARNFMLLGPRHGELLEVRLLNSAGKVLRRIAPQALTGDSPPPEPSAEPTRIVEPTRTNTLSVLGPAEFSANALQVGRVVRLGGQTIRIATETEEVDLKISSATITWDGIGWIANMPTNVGDIATAWGARSPDHSFAVQKLYINIVHLQGKASSSIQGGQDASFVLTDSYQETERVTVAPLTEIYEAASGGKLRYQENRVLPRESQFVEVIGRRMEDGSILAVTLTLPD